MYNFQIKEKLMKRYFKLASVCLAALTVSLTFAAAMIFNSSGADTEAQAFDANTSFASKTYASAANSLVLPYRLYVPEN